MMELFNRYVGIPWRDGGRDREGCDCWGLIRMVYRDLAKIDVPSYSEEYGSAQDREQVSRSILGHSEWDRWLPVARGRERLLDGILLLEGGQPRHVGLVCDPAGHLMLHMKPKFGSVIERYNTGSWSERIEGFYRHEELLP